MFFLLLGRAVIESPVVTIVTDTIYLGQSRTKIRICVGFQMLDDATIVATKIRFKPVVNARHDQTAVLDLRAAGMVDEITCRGFEQSFGVGSSKRLRLQVRATKCGAVHRVVDASILPDRTQDAVFDVIQRESLIFDGYEFQPPWAEREEPGFDFSNALYWIVFQYDIDGERIVQVHPVGELLGAVVSADVERGQALDVGLQRLVVSGRDTTVGDAVDTVGAGDNETIEPGTPGAVVNGPAGVRIVRAPAWP